MNELPFKGSKTLSEGLSCFVLVYCLFVPIGGTVISLFLLNSINEDLAIAGMACLYLSSTILGAINVKQFRQNRDRVEFWTLVIGMSLSGICFLIAVAALILLRAAVALRVIS
jgi:hypothetical protein